MMEGLLRHCTDMEVEKNYVDSHGQSEVAFAFCHLLGYKLMPRLKAIHTQKLYRPEPGMTDAYANLQHVLTRPINWELIRQQYDQMVSAALVLPHVGVSTTIIPATTNSLNDLPKQLYSHGSAVINTLQQIAGAAGTALAITLMTIGQHRFTVEHSKASPETLVAAGTQFTFGAIVIVAVIGLLLALFVRRATNHSH